MKVPMKRPAVFAVFALMQMLPAIASELPVDPFLQGGAPGARTRMLILREVDSAMIDDKTLHEIGALLESADGVVVSRAAVALGRIGRRSLPYTRRLQQIVSEESCNMTGVGAGDFASVALINMGIPPRPRGCLAWTR